MPPSLPRTHLERGMDHRATHQAHLREQREEMRDDTEVQSAQELFENSQEHLEGIWHILVETLRGERTEMIYGSQIDDSDLLSECKEINESAELIRHAIHGLVTRIHQPRVIRKKRRSVYHGDYDRYDEDGYNPYAYDDHDDYYDDSSEPTNEELERASEGAKNDLNHFLKRLTPYLLKKEPLKEIAIEALIDAGEVTALQEHFQKDYFSPEEENRIFIGFIKSQGTLVIGDEFFTGLKTLEEWLGIGPDWSQPTVRTALIQTYESLLRQSIVPLYWQRYIELIKVSGVDPAQWSPPYGPLLGAIRASFKSLAEQGMIESAREMERVTGQVLSRAEEKQIVSVAFKDLFSDISVHISYENLSQLKSTFEEKIDRLFANGGDNLPLRECIAVITPILARAISDLARVDTPNSVLALEWFLRVLIERVGIPPSFFTKQFSGELVGYYIAQRYDYPFNFAARQTIVARIEELTGVAQPPLDPSISKGRVMQGLEMMQASRMYSEAYDFDLRPYLKEHRSLILESGEKHSHVARAALRGVERLASMEQNPLLPEQIEALRDIGLSFELDEEHKLSWLHRQVQQQGLLFDPQREGLRLDVRCYRGFEKNLNDRYETALLSSGPVEVLSSQLIKAHNQSPEGWGRIAKILEESEVSGEDKIRLIRTLIHCIDIPSIEFARTAEKGGRSIIRSELQDLLEGITNLPFSKEEVQELFQELYATYLLQQREFLDSDLLQNVPPLELTHPSIIAARVRLTKDYLLDSLTVTSRDGLLAKPSRLLLSEWPDAQRQEFLVSLDELDPDLPVALQNRNMIHQDTDEQQATNLEQTFSCWISGLVSTPELVQFLIAHGDTIDRLCKSSTSFRASYETLLAKSAGRAEFPLLYVEKKLRDASEGFSARGCEQVIEEAVHSGEWSVVEAILHQYPKRSTRLLQRLKKEIIFRLPQYLADSRMIDAGKWLSYVVEHYPDLLIQEQKKPEFPWEGYQELLGIIYEYKLSTVNILTAAPGIKLAHKNIHKAFASASVTDVLTRGATSFRLEALQVNWSDPMIRTLTVSKIKQALPTSQQLKGHQSTIQAVIDGLKTIQEQTGYHISDPVFYRTKEFFGLKELVAEVERWERLAALAGEGPTDRANFRSALQEQIDLFCIRGLGTAAEYLDIKKNVQLIPSDEALRGYVMKACYASPEGALKSGELLKVVGRSVELSADQIRTIPKGTARAEALIYTLVLPKQGPERALAEKAYRERSELAALIPQLLAIQSPAKRTEFCPYQQGLTPLLNQDSSLLRDATRRRGLLLFLKEFGMQYLPKLALAIVDLAVSFENPERPRETVALVRYRELLGVGQEQWTMEQYLEKTHELIQAIRQTILEDTPLDARIEQNPIGMELFNAVVPHTGSYFSVDDRPRLLALTRTYADSLIVDPWYTPVSILVDVAEQEQATAGAKDGSPTERAINLRREQIKKKYQDETMLRFMKGWEESARLMVLEPTGKSPVYWFSIVHDRIDAQIVVLQEKKTGIKNEKGIEAIEKKISRLTDMSERLLLLMKQDTESDPEGQSPARRLEELQSVFVNAQGKVDRVELESQAGDVARALTLSMMYEHSPHHYEAVQRAGAEQVERDALSPPLLKAWEAWFREEYLEHFAGFNPDVDVPLTSATRLLLQKLWRIDGLEGDIVKMRAGEKEAIPMTHPLIGPFTNIRRLEEEIHQLERTQRSGNQQPLQFWPVKRIGRVLAGDIANACYNSRRHGLAQGEEKRITALLMTIPGETEIAGSTLLIDTKTRSGKRVLVIRALNPTEAVIRKSLDARAVVEATIEYAKGVARATATSANPIQEIRLCYDHRGGHSTNREEVHEAETKLVQEHKWVSGEDLENVTETNFNGYNIHDKYQTRIVWERATTILLA